MKRFIITILLLAFAGLSFGAENLPAIIPLPRKVVCKGKIAFTLTESTRILLPRNDKVLRRTAEIFVQTIAREQNLMLKIREKDSGEIRLTVDPQLAEEAYRLDITASGIDIRGGSSAGVFYGLQSFRQLLAQYGTVLPALQIEDAPSFGYRGAMLDCGRHFFTVDEIKTFIDLLALHKINRFHWHLTEDQGWRIEIRRYPELTKIGSQRSETVLGNNSPAYDGTPYGGYYTQDQLRDVVTYAAERFIVIIPEIEMPGHASAALAAYPNLGCIGEGYKVRTHWGVFPEVFCAGKESTIEFLQNVLEEVIKLFPSEYIHVGGDECAKRWWQESEETQQFMREHELKDEKALQSYFIHYVQKVVNAKGKTLIGWDEILEGGISEDCIVMNWRRPEFGKKAVRTNHRTIFTCSAWSYFNLKESRIQSEIGPRGPLSLEKVYEFQIVPDSLTTEQQELVWGAQGCLWTEYIPTTWKAEFAIFPRMSALAENVWSPLEKKDWINFTRKVEMQFERYELWGARYSEAFFRTQDIERKR